MLWELSGASGMLTAIRRTLEIWPNRWRDSTDSPRWDVQQLPFVRRFNMCA